MTEDEFLGQLIAGLPACGREVCIPPGDDCAGVLTAGGKVLLIGVDQVVGDRHYVATGAAAAAPELVGRKLLARNLSDIAAMGGRPTYCVVAGAFSPECGDEWLRGFYAGIRGLADAFGVAMIGGDVARTAGATVASLTILGEAAAGRVGLRSGASAGDCLYVTGCFGDAGPTGHHLTFTPRCSEGRWLVEEGHAAALMDVSDGLLLDATRLCRASGVGLRLDIAAVPRRTRETTSAAVLGDGEDYELLVAIPASGAADVEAAWPFPTTPLTRVGEFGTWHPGEVRGPDGEPFRPVGWDHLAN